MGTALDLDVVINLFGAASACTVLTGGHGVEFAQQRVRLDIVPATKTSS